MNPVRELAPNIKPRARTGEMHRAACVHRQAGAFSNGVNVVQLRPMTKMLSAAIKEIRKLPAQVQENIGIDLIDRVAAWRELREKIAVGIREADAGLARPLSRKALLKMVREHHAKKEK